VSEDWIDKVAVQIRRWIHGPDGYHLGTDAIVDLIRKAYTEYLSSLQDVPPNLSAMQDQVDAAGRDLVTVMKQNKRLIALLREAHAGWRQALKDNRQTVADIEAVLKG